MYCDIIIVPNIDTDNALVRDYPYTFIQLGLLIEILFFNLAIVSKWTRLEREEAVFDLKSELAIVQLRSQLSKELHDDIGAELSGINLYSHMATMQSSSGKMEEATKSISVIQESSTKVINRLKDIVWAINPVENELQNLIDKIEEFARYAVNAVGIQVELLIPENLPILNFSAQIKHHIFLISKEVINNVIKYSKATNLVILANHKNGIFSLIIKDNGIGFNVNNLSQGNGLTNIKRRAQEINAGLDIKSSPQSGTIISLSCSMI
jgi:signal transduction histidine kinase